MLLQIGVMGGCYCWHGWCRGSCVQCWPWLCSLMFELFWCHCNPWQQWGWVGAALHPLVSSWHVGPRWAPAPGILQGNRVVTGELWQTRGVNCLCPAPACACSPHCILSHACGQVLPSLSRLCLDRCAEKGTLNFGNHCVVHLPDAFPVLQLADMAGELWADHLLSLVDKAARLPKANRGDHTVSGWKNRSTVFF